LPHLRPAIRPTWKTIAGLLLICCLMPGSLFGQEAPERNWSEKLGIDFGYFTSTTSLVVLGVAGAGAAWSWEETDENFAALQRSLDGSTLEIPIDIGNEYGSGLVLGGTSLGIMLTGSLVDNESMQDFGTDLLRSFAYSALVTGTIKYTVNRKRPGGGRLSFPSGHTTSAFSTVPAAWHHTGWKGGIPVTLLAGLTAMGRMEDNRHYLSDVLVGAAIGYIVGSAVVSQRAQTGQNPRVVITPRQAGLAWSF
jgi:hypothetical protein